MDSIIEHPPVQLTAIIGKGNGLVATRDLTPGTLLLDEPPLLKLDPPCKRAELLKLLGCRAFSTIDMKAAPEAIRTTIHKMILEKEVAKMSQEEKAYLFSLEDKHATPTNSTASWRDSGYCSPTTNVSAADDAVIKNKSLWGIWLTNCVPLGSYRASAIFPSVARLNHSCRPNAHHIWCPETGREQVWIVEPVRRGEEVTISYIRTFCSRRFRQSLLFERFGFVCHCAACSLEGVDLELDDARRMEIDDLAQRFAQVRQQQKLKNEDQQQQHLSEAIEIGEKILFLMQLVGFNSSVQWPGFFNCFELYLQAGDLDKAKFYVNRAYQLVCEAKGQNSKDAQTMLKYKSRPELYLTDFKASEQHYIATLTNC